MPLNIKDYRLKTKAFEVTLTAGEKVDVTYYPNFLTGEALRQMDENRKAAAETGGTLAMYNAYRDHLAYALADVDLVDGSKKIPFKTEDEKKEALNLLSYEDLQAINEQMQTDLASFLEKAGTD